MGLHDTGQLLHGMRLGENLLAVGWVVLEPAWTIVYRPISMLAPSFPPLLDTHKTIEASATRSPKRPKMTTLPPESKTAVVSPFSHQKDVLDRASNQDAVSGDQFLDEKQQKFKRMVMVI